MIGTEVPAMVAPCQAMDGLRDWLTLAVVPPWRMHARTASVGTPQRVPEEMLSDGNVITWLSWQALVTVRFGALIADVGGQLHTPSPATSRHLRRAGGAVPWLEGPATGALGDPRPGYGNPIEDGLATRCFSRFVYPKHRRMHTESHCDDKEGRSLSDVSDTGDRRQPNLLYIVTDQQRVDTMCCYGNDLIQVPALNELATQSFVFDHAYVSQPVCSPSRATMMTGLWPHTAGVESCNVPLPLDVPTIAEMLPDEYACAYMGKWHLGDEIFAQHGFETWVGTENSYRRHYSDRERLSSLSDYSQFLLHHGFEPDTEVLGSPVFSRHMEAGLDEELTKASFLGMRAAEYIHEHRDQPFALCVSYLEPHPPHTGPLNDLYAPWSLPTGPAFMGKPDASVPLVVRLMAAIYMESEEYGHDLRTEEGWRHVMARYWGNTTLVDRSVGRILQALHECGLADDTVVVYTSDHGEQMGDHGILGKTVMYEESIRVPLLLRAPMLAEDARRIDGNFSHIDLLPTLLDILAVGIPDRLQGESRAPVLRREADLSGNDVFCEWNGANGHLRASIGEAEINRSMAEPLRTVISADRWKLNLYTRGAGELYNLNDDPRELQNLFNRPEHRERRRDLFQRLRRWQQGVDDRAPLPEP
jgi:arylsulfatase A-like enzyme